MHKQSIYALAIALCATFAAAAPHPGRSTDLNAQGNGNGNPSSVQTFEEFKNDDYDDFQEYKDLYSKSPPTDPIIRDRLQKKIASDMEKTLVRITRNMGNTGDLKQKLEKAKKDPHPADSIMNQLLSLEYSVKELQKEIGKGVFRADAQMQLHEIVEEYDQLDTMLVHLEVNDISDRFANLEDPEMFKKETVQFLVKICEDRQESWEELEVRVNDLTKYSLRFNKGEKDSIPEMAAQCKAETMQLYEDCAQIDDIKRGADIFKIKRNIQVEVVSGSQERWDKLYKRVLELQKKGTSARLD